MADFSHGEVLTAPALPSITPAVVEEDISEELLIAPALSSINEGITEILPTVVAAVFHFDGASFVDETAAANEGTANDVTLLEDTSDFLYIGEDANMDWIAFNIGTAGTVGTFTIEYSTLVGWSVLPAGNFSSNLNNFRTAGFVDLFVKAPSDWDDQLVNGETRRWIRFNCDGNYTIDPLGTQIWTNTISTNRFLTSLDNMAIDDTGAGGFVQDIRPALSDTFFYEDRASGFSFNIGFLTGLQDTLVITDISNIPQNLAVSDLMAIADAIATLVGPFLTFSDSLLLADAIVLLEGHITDPADGIVAILANPPSIHGEVWMGYIAIGIGTTASWDTGELENEVYRKVAVVRSIKNTYLASATFGQDEPTEDNLAITEIGLFDDAVSGNMTKRWFLNTAIAKDNIDEIPIQCAIVFLAGEITSYDNGLDESFGFSDSIGLVMARVDSYSDNLTMTDSVNLVIS